MTQPAQSLATTIPAHDLVQRVIREPHSLFRALPQLREHYHVLGPASVMVEGFVTYYGLSSAIVAVDTRVNEYGQGPETYYDFAFMTAPRKRDDETGKWRSVLTAPDAQRALSKSALDRIALAAGLDWVPYPMSNTMPNFCHYVATGRLVQPDGGVTSMTDQVVVDLRDGSAQIGEWTPDAWRALIDANAAQLKTARTPAEAKELRDTLDWAINGWSDKRVLQARRHLHTNAESKAKNRVVRRLGVKPVYTVSELQAKPFLIFKAVFQPDMRDPEQRRAVTERALYGASLFSAPSAGRPMASVPVGAPSDVIDVAVVQTDATQAAATPVTPSTNAAAQTSTSTPGAGQTPATPSASATSDLKVTRIEPATGLTGGKSWTVWWITFSDGRCAGTDDGELALWARRYKNEHEVVVPHIEPASKPGALRLVTLVALKDVPAQTAGAAPRQDDVFPL